MAAERIPQSATIRVPLQAYLSSDHVTPATGKTIVVTISKNGAAYGNPSGGATNAVEIASGSYYVDLSTTDTGTLGPLFVLGTSATIDNIVTIYNIVKATNGGFTALPDTAATTNASLLTSGTGTDQLSVASGRIDLGKILGTAVSTPATAGILDVNVKNIDNDAASASGTVTFPNATLASTTNITAGTITTVTNLTNAPTAGDLTATMKTSVATAALTTQMTESYAALGVVPTLAQAAFEIRSILAENSVAGTTVTTRKIDGTTTAETFTLDSDTAPTTITRAS